MRSNKALLYISSLLFSLGMVMFSCSSDDDDAPQITQSVTFGFSVEDNDTGRTASNHTPAKVSVTIQDMEGEVTIHNGLELDLLANGDSYVTADPVQFVPGSYQLTLFQVLNEGDMILYASPLEGSKNAALVEKPLPLEFTVKGDKTTTVVPEVLAVKADDNPGDFGYAGFGYKVVNTFGLNIDVTSDVDGSPLGGTWLFTGYDEDSVAVTGEEYLLVYPKSESGSGVVLDGDALFYKVESLERPDFHQVTHYFTTEYLKEKGSLSFSMASTAINGVIQLGRKSYGLNKADFYYPLDPCVHNDFRLDYTGLYSTLELDENYIEVYMDCLIVDGSFSPLSNISVTSPLYNPNVIFKPDNLFIEDVSFCQVLPEKFDGVGLLLQILVPTTAPPYGNGDQFGFIGIMTIKWNIDAQEWIFEVYGNEEDSNWHIVK